MKNLLIVFLLLLSSVSYSQSLDNRPVSSLEDDVLIATQDPTGNISDPYDWSQTTIADFKAMFNIFRTKYGNVAGIDSSKVLTDLETDDFTYLERSVLSTRIKLLDKGEYTRYTTASTSFNFAVSATIPVDDSELPWRYRANKTKTVGTGFSEKKVLQGFDKSTSFSNDHDLVFEFETDADSIELGMLQNNESIYIVVNDSVYKYTTSLSGNLYYTMLELPYFDSTSRLVRIFTNNLYFRGVGVQNNYTLSSPTYEVTANFFVTGDSFIKGSSSLGFSILGMLSVLNPSINFYNGGVGATGYVDSGNALNIPDRLAADVAVFSDVAFDGILSFAGFNDAVSDVSGVENGLLETKTVCDNLGLPLYLSTPWPLDYATANSPSLANLKLVKNITIKFLRENKDVGFLGDAHKQFFPTSDGTHPTFDGAWRLSLYFNKNFKNFSSL